jgi:propanol-preferring alcohol dehydrogenase
MRAMALTTQAPASQHPLIALDLPEPVPGPGEVLVAVEACGVCRTDLHVVEGDLPLRCSPTVPGHEVVGRVIGHGPGAGRLPLGTRVGVAWLYASCGQCPYCRAGHENLCTAPRFTGWTEPGGYAERLRAREDFVYPLPEGLDALAATPLLCAGIIGYRALVRSRIQPGEPLGLYGFGASAHIAIQVARHWGCPVYVATRGRRHQALARELGATWVGDTVEPPPVALRGAILFAPAGEIVPAALAALDRGGTLAVAGIHLSDIPVLDYQRHLFQERTLCSVTANTRADGAALLRLAAEIPIVTHTEAFPLERANEALARLRDDEVAGAAVLRVGAA